MSFYKDNLPIKKRILMNPGVQKCPQDVITSLLEVEPSTTGNGNESEIQSERGRGIELSFSGQTSSEPSLNVHNSQSLINMFDCEVKMEIEETLEHSNVQHKLTVDSDHESDCVVVDCNIPTIDITEEVSTDENEEPKDNHEVNHGLSEPKHHVSSMEKEKQKQPENGTESSHRDITMNCDSDLDQLLTESCDTEQIVGAKKDAEFAGNLVATEDHNNNNQALPDGWSRIRHDGELDFYIHAESLVCTMALPYDLGSGSARHHNIPVEAIPCLYKKLRKDTGDEADLGVLSGRQIHTYCAKNLFKFKTRKSLFYKTWKSKRWHDSLIKRYRQANQPSACTVKLPVRNERRKDILLPFDVKNKSYLELLSEYLNLAFKKQVKYLVEPLQHHGQDFLATIFLDGIWFGSGTGGTKKLAKNQAARLLLAAIFGIVPELQNLKNWDKLQDVGEKNVLDEIDIDDSRVTLFCKKKNEMLPFAMLEIALGRNKNLKELKLQHNIVKVSSGIEYVMQVGRYSANVKCRNKVEGKHEAAQAILKQIHPILRSWGGLVRLHQKSVKIDQNDNFRLVYREEEENCQVNQTLINQLNCRFSKLEEKRNELLNEGMKKSHYDVLWDSSSMKLSYGLDCEEST